MKSQVFAACVALAVLISPAAAQDEMVYIQVQARTSLSAAESGVREFGQRFDNVAGFALGGGWYGVALGPYERTDAVATLRALVQQGLIPRDSYVEELSDYGQQFWPVGAQAARAAQIQAQPVPDAPQTQEPAATAPEAAPAPAPQPEPEPEVVDETPRQARASEALLTRDEKKELQIAMKWAGTYSAAIDGSYGRGTRRAMAEWQGQNGFEITGILTTLQRAELLRQYNAVLEGMDLALYTDGMAGVEMELPRGAVKFDRYEAPFAIFSPTSDELEARVLLISQPGDRNTLGGLYEIMQTLEIVPLDGERERTRNGFLLSGANDKIASHTEVVLRDGVIKGFTLIWPAGDEERRSRILDRMQKSFAPTEGVLDPAAVTDEGQSVDLVSGLKIRTPKTNASGFFIDSVGRVITTASAVENCSRVTLNGVHEAQVANFDAEADLAVLRPVDRLAPMGVAAFAAEVPRLQSELAVAGYSFGGVLTAPTLTFGTLADVKGLRGEKNIKRLAISALPGDAGGPIFDTGGAVVGMLLPALSDGSQRLPEGVSFGAKSESILTFLSEQGISPVTGFSSDPIAPEDLTTLATQMTVLVGCWE